MHKCIINNSTKRKTANDNDDNDAHQLWERNLGIPSPNGGRKKNSPKLKIFCFQELFRFVIFHSYSFFFFPSFSILSLVIYGMTKDKAF